MEAKEAIERVRKKADELVKEFKLVAKNEETKKVALEQIDLQLRRWVLLNIHPAFTMEQKEREAFLRDLFGIFDQTKAELQ